MLAQIIIPRSRHLALGFVVLPIVTLVVYFQYTANGVGTAVEAVWPSDILHDYTTPASQCIFPSEQDEADKRLNGDSAGYYTIGKQSLPDVVPVAGLERYMQAHLDELAAGFNASHDLEAYGIDLGNVSLQSYRDELLSTYAIYLAPTFSNSKSKSKAKAKANQKQQNTGSTSKINSIARAATHAATYLPPIRSRLSLRPPIAPLPPLPRQIITTDKGDAPLPTEFAHWDKIMPEWEKVVYDDEGLKAWVHRHFGRSIAEAIWTRLPRVVLKTDMFRYMIMLVEGGIYTDSDTAPIIHAEDWGLPYESATSPLMTHLSRLLSLATSPHLPPSHPFSSLADVSDDEVDVQPGPNVYDGPIVNDGSELGEPALVVSIEFDAPSFGWTQWRDMGLSRAVQITQWTFMARPGHPVFLDALGRIMRKTEQIEAELAAAESQGEEYLVQSALEWTGPAVFTDCVYRYLLARYGFLPSELVDVKSPLRVGDVLILPPGSFSSLSPFEEEEQRPWAASYHGFLGRWRDDDPAIQALEQAQAQHEQEEKLRIEQEQEKGVEEQEAKNLAEEANLEALAHEGQPGDAGGEEPSA